MAILTDAQSRKARRKEERRAKKKLKRKFKNESSHHDATSEHDPLPKKAKKSRRIKEAAKYNRIDHSGGSDVSNKGQDDPYADLEPDVAAAMRSDDAEIAELESKLGLANEKEKKRLHREYAKLEGYGDDFGDFLDDLDDLTDRVSGKLPASEYDGRHNEVGFSRDEAPFDHYATSSDEEEIVPMKDGGVDPWGEEESLDNSMKERGSHSDEENDVESNGKVANGESGSDSEASSQSEESEEADHDVRDTYHPTEGEDIYGNKREGSISDQPPKKYVPPHLRTKEPKEDDADRINALRSLERSLNNLLNRLSEDTMISVAQSIAKLYPSYPTSDVNDCLWKNMRNACVAKPIVMSGLIPVYVACMTGVHFQTGDQVQLGGFLLEQVVTQLWTELSNARNMDKGGLNDVDGDISKEASNLVLVLCYMYSFGIVHCALMFDVIRDLIRNFSELDVEVLLLVLRHCGYSLRSDDPLSLKEIVLMVQDRATEAKNSESDKAIASSSRVQYMIGAMTDLKNNKKSKQDVAYGEKTAKLRKLLGRIKSTVAASGIARTSDSSLRITLNDLLNVETKGRWWKAGASWIGNQFQHRDDDDNNAEVEKGRAPMDGRKSSTEADSDDKLLRLASKLRMNTDIKRSIFCIIMSSEDCDDSFEKLVRAGMLKNRMERDTVRVLVECCGNEKSYNPFYSHLASRICDYQPQCKFTFQLAFWDIFKQFDAIKMRKAANLAKLLFHLVAIHHSLKLNIFKVVDMSPDAIPESGVIFLTVFFSSIFDSFDDPAQIKDLFDRSIPRSGSGVIHQHVEELNDEGESLRESLSVFFLQTLKSSPKNKSKSNFRANFKAAVKACETDSLDSMVAM